MNPQLGREVTRAITKARMTTPALAKRTGLGESWIKQVRSGRIAKPKPDWLTRLAEEVGADSAEWLALSNQLGAAVDYRGASGTDSALIQALDRNSNMIEALVVMLAKREGIVLFDLAETESSIVDQIAAAAGSAPADLARQPRPAVAPTAQEAALAGRANQALIQEGARQGRSHETVGPATPPPSRKRPVPSR